MYSPAPLHRLFVCKSEKVVLETKNRHKLLLYIKAKIHKLSICTARNECILSETQSTKIMQILAFYKNATNNQQVEIMEQN